MPVAAQATHRVHMEVVPLFAGHLPLPDVRLFKYLPHHSAHSAQPDAGEDRRGAGLRIHSTRPVPAGTSEPSQGDRPWPPARRTCCCTEGRGGEGRGGLAAVRPLSHFVCVLQIAG